MEKTRQIARVVGASLVLSALWICDFYFYHLWILDNTPKFLWIPFSILAGCGLGFLFDYLVRRVWRVFPRINWLYYFLLVSGLSLIIFQCKDFYYQPLKANSFSETSISINARQSNQEEIIIKDIRVDQHVIPWQENCQLSGSYRWVREGALALENKTGTPGEINCRFYPGRSVDVLFDPQSLMADLSVMVNGSTAFIPVTPVEKGDWAGIGLLAPARKIIPNLLLFANIFFLLHLLLLTWIAFQTGHPRQAGKYPLVGMVIAFLICYGLFFMQTVFFNPQHGMAFPKTISTVTPIGADFFWIIDHVQKVVFNHQALEGSYYSPGSFYFFIPFALLDHDAAYLWYSLFKWVVFIFTVLIFPVLWLTKQEKTLPFFFLFTGLLSYGWEFELERGQGYTPAFALVILSVWLFQNHYEKWPLRGLSYLLYTIAIQMKLTPVIFIFFFIRDWRDIKSNIRRFILLGCVNLLLVFSTGFSNGLAFINSILWIGGTSSPVTGVQNHSINNFVLYVQSGILENILYFHPIYIALAVCCLLLGLYKLLLGYRSDNHTQFDPLVLIIFCLAVLLIPNENNDYTLAVIPLALAVGLSLETASPNPRLKAVDLWMIGLLYSMTLFSDVYKPDWPIIQNNCPAVFGLLVYMTIMAWKKEIGLLINKRWGKESPTAADSLVD